jgi:hypothetical protein
LDNASARQLLALLRDPGGEHDFLDGNLTAQELIMSEPDNAHSTVAEGPRQAVPSIDQMIGPPDMARD